MDQDTIERLKRIFWRMSREEWIDHSYAEAVDDLEKLIRKYEPTLGPAGTPIVRTSVLVDRLTTAAPA